MPLADAQTERFRFRTPGEAKALASHIAAFAEDSLSVQLGLSELMQNAIEHGICGIGRTQKARYLRDDCWPDILLDKLNAPDCRDLTVAVEMNLTPEALSVTITDPGQGFDWRTASTLSADDYSGRGLKIVEDLVFDAVQFNEVGNSVTVTTSADLVSLG